MATSWDTEKCLQVIRQKVKVILTI